MVCVHKDGVLADQVLRKAERLHSVGIDIWEQSSVEWISEDNLDQLFTSVLR